MVKNSNSNSHYSLEREREKHMHISLSECVKMPLGDKKTTIFTIKEILVIYTQNCTQYNQQGVSDIEGKVKH